MPISDITTTANYDPAQAYGVKEANSEGNIRSFAGVPIDAPDDDESLVVINTLTGLLYSWNGVTWVDVSGGGGSSNLGYTPAVSGGTVTNDAGTNATLTDVDATNAGLMTPTQRQSLIDAEAFTSTFDNAASWGAASGGSFTITILAVTHLKGTGVTSAQIQEDNGTGYEVVTTDSLIVDKTTGDVSFSVPEVPDGRFTGRIIIN